MYLVQPETLVEPYVGARVTAPFGDESAMDHWAWYCFPTTKPGFSDPCETALVDTEDARTVLADEGVRGAWAEVLELLAEAMLVQRTRLVLSAIDHGRVHFFIKEWQDENLFSPAAREHAAEAVVVICSWRDPESL